MNYDPFVWPFVIGLAFCISVLCIKYAYWIITLQREEKLIFWKGFFSLKLLSAAKEAFMESLLHRRIFRVNTVLGFMHMSLAFGWFLLIIIGSIESKLFNHQAINNIWDPIFLRYFAHDIHNKPMANVFGVIMDGLLFFLLLAVLFAVIKRTVSLMFGMKRTTRLKLFDQVAMKALWLIFPMRFIAESMTAAIYQNGSFLTNPAGKVFAYMLPVHHLEYAAWWGYSIVLCGFFLAVPFSRYMHIPTEVILIMMRKFGVKSKKEYDSFAKVEVNSCPRCGICIDKCQMNISKELYHSTSVYFLQSVRNDEVEENKAFNCMLCGRCEEYCPVGIHTINQRITQRKKFVGNNGFNYSYLTEQTTKRSASVLYFAGCMSHLTPGITQSMKKIFETAGIAYTWMDEDGSICCGRPLLTAGKEDAAKQLMEKNKELIELSGAEVLITSCPICYKAFREEYNLSIPVKHHSEYINELIKEKQLPVRNTDIRVVYHDPCDLGRGSKIYAQPRRILKKTGHLIKLRRYYKEDSLCCGGSLGQLTLTLEQKDKITRDAVSSYLKPKPEVLVTACPLCKKTFSKHTNVPVKDIAEFVSEALTKS